MRSFETDGKEAVKTCHKCGRELCDVAKHLMCNEEGSDYYCLECFRTCWYEDYLRKDLSPEKLAIADDPPTTKLGFVLRREVDKIGMLVVMLDEKDAREKARKASLGNASDAGDQALPHVTS